MKPHEPCTIHWVDITSPGQYWADVEEAGLTMCVSRGFFVKESTTDVTIAQTLTAFDNKESDAHYGGMLTIPKGAVVKIETDT